VFYKLPIIVALVVIMFIHRTSIFRGKFKLTIVAATSIYLVGTAAKIFFEQLNTKLCLGFSTQQF